MEKIYKTNPETRINELMQKRNLKIMDVVTGTGIQQSTLSMMFSAKRSLSLSHIIKLSDFFECSIDYMLYRSNEIIQQDNDILQNIKLELESYEKKLDSVSEQSDMIKKLINKL